MKEFFIECLRNLEPLTGIRQLYYLQSDLEEGERKFAVLIEGMVQASRAYPYIPDLTQQSIIRKMMVEDQNYDGLNSRIIHKWLSLHNGKYSHLTEADLIQHEPAPPEVADKYAEEFLANLSKIGNPDKWNSDGERKDPILRGMVGTPRPFTGLDPNQLKISEYVQKLGKWKDRVPNRMWDVEGLKVPGDSEEEAREIYMMAIHG